MVGHKTQSVYRRYAIADERMLTEAGEKLQTLYDSSEARPRSIVPLDEARAGRSPKAWGRKGGSKRDCLEWCPLRSSRQD